MKIKQFEIFKSALPFRRRFKHARSSRTHSASIFVRCELEDGTVGFGESLPREYVTGESWQGCFDDLKLRILPLLLDCDFNHYEAAEDFCASLYDFLLENVPHLPRRVGAACCAAELALLDTYGRYFNRTSFAGTLDRNPLYSGVISSSGPVTTILTSLLCRHYQMPAVKLKVGGSNDISSARIARLILKPKTSLRADANMGWTTEQALSVIPALKRLKIQYIEQPIKTGLYDDLRRIQQETDVPIIVDEDLCDHRDAQALAESGACSVFNVRVSKCGGFFNSLRIARIAQKHGLKVQVGCQVGETALLSAVGLALARRLAPVVFAEGCFGTRLLKEDLMDVHDSQGQVPFEFSTGGVAPRYEPIYGTGIAVNERSLRNYTQAQCMINRSNRESQNK